MENRNQSNVRVNADGGIDLNLNFDENEQNEHQMEHIEDIFGSQFRTLMDHFMSRTSSSREISKSFLTTMGKMNVDPNDSILVDCYVEVGGLKIMCVPASFSKIPINSVIQGNLIRCNESCVPHTSDSSSIFNITNTNTNTNATPTTTTPISTPTSNIFLSSRGGITFAKKAINAQNMSKSAGLIVIQSFPMWPFVMSDNANEIKTAFDSSGLVIDIPIVCISQSDGELLLEYINETNKRNKSSNNTNSATSKHTNNGNNGNLDVKIVFGDVMTECSICQEDMDFKSMNTVENTGDDAVVHTDGTKSTKNDENKDNVDNVDNIDNIDGELIYKLPCRHCYHVNCVTQWLESHNTCPMCRYKMPTEKKTEEELSTPIQPNSILHDTMYH